MSINDYRENIIKFVEASPDEENLHIAIFIAGMQAQKGIDSTENPRRRGKQSRQLV